MDRSDSPDEAAFRKELRAFFAEHPDEELRRKVRLSLPLTKAEHEGWHAKLQERGWLAGSWPREFGGAGWGAVERHIFEEELARAEAPRIVPFGIAMLGPVLQKFGTKAQQDHFLPRILSGQDWWCQGYSEPGAGSDLASLKTSARREGDHYVVNGQKTWTTLAQHADWIFCLVRTDASVKPQEGISFLLIDMKTPGVEVRPIELIDGGHEVNEVWFTDVRVPVENLVGEENKGWTCAKFLLTHERTNIAGVGFAKAALADLQRASARREDGGRAAIDNPVFAARLAMAEIELLAMETTNLRALAKAAAGGAPGAESSMLKVKGSVIRQEIDDLHRRAGGAYALLRRSEEETPGVNDPLPGPASAHAASARYLNQRKLSIYGGSNEVQRTIIAKSILGL